MVFQPGNVRPNGSGRVKGTPNKRTELIDALKEVYGGDGITPFWKGVARDSDGSGPMAAMCKKLIADRLSPTLKSVEVKADTQALAVIIQRFTEIDAKTGESASIPPVIDVTPIDEKASEVTDK